MNSVDKNTINFDMSLITDDRLLGMKYGIEHVQRVPHQVFAVLMVRHANENTTELLRICITLLSEGRKCGIITLSSPPFRTTVSSRKWQAVS